MLALKILIFFLNPSLFQVQYSHWKTKNLKTIEVPVTVAIILPASADAQVPITSYM